MSPPRELWEKVAPSVTDEQLKEELHRREVERQRRVLEELMRVPLLDRVERALKAQAPQPGEEPGLLVLPHADVALLVKACRGAISGCRCGGTGSYSYQEYCNEDHDHGFGCAGSAVTHTVTCGEQGCCLRDTLKGERR